MSEEQTSYVVHVTEPAPPRVKVSIERNSRGHTYSVEVTDVDLAAALAKGHDAMVALAAEYGPQEDSHA